MRPSVVCDSFHRYQMGEVDTIWGGWTTSCLEIQDGHQHEVDWALDLTYAMIFPHYYQVLAQKGLRTNRTLSNSCSRIFDAQGDFSPLYIIQYIVQIT